MTQYTVRTKKEVKNLNEGHLWSEELPDSMFVKKFNFTGHEFGPVRGSPKHYELFWDPQNTQVSNRATHPARQAQDDIETRGDSR